MLQNSGAAGSDGERRNGWCGRGVTEIKKRELVAPPGGSISGNFPPVAASWREKSPSDLRQKLPPSTRFVHPGTKGSKRFATPPVTYTFTSTLILSQVTRGR